MNLIRVIFSTALAAIGAATAGIPDLIPMPMGTDPKG
jgi:hypothetical protein